MIDTEKVIQSIYESIDEVNEQLPQGEKLQKELNASLFGDGGPLDSLGLVSLITTVEQKIEEDFEISFTILEELEALENENPFQTLKTLVDYVTSALEQRISG